MIYTKQMLKALRSKEKSTISIVERQHNILKVATTKAIERKAEEARKAIERKAEEARKADDDANPEPPKPLVPEPATMIPTPAIIGKSESGSGSGNGSVSVSGSYTTDVATIDEPFFRSDNPMAYVVIGGGILTLGSLTYFASQ